MRTAGSDCAPAGAASASGRASTKKQRKRRWFMSKPECGEQALPPAWPLLVAQHAVAEVGDARIGETRRDDHVVLLQVDRAHPAFEADLLALVVDLEQLL